MKHPICIYYSSPTGNGCTLSLSWQMQVIPSFVYAFKMPVTSDITFAHFQLVIGSSINKEIITILHRLNHVWIKIKVYSSVICLSWHLNDISYIEWVNVYHLKALITWFIILLFYISEGVRLRATRGGSADPRTFSSRRSSTDSSEDGFNINVRDLKVNTIGHW